MVVAEPRDGSALAVAGGGEAELPARRSRPGGAVGAERCVVAGFCFRPVVRRGEALHLG